MAERRWAFAKPDREKAGDLARTLGISPITAQLLINRGISDVSVAKEFLQPELAQLAEPARFAHMGRAVERIGRAIRDGERIAIFGDYDVDGTTGTAIIAKFLGLLGHDPFIKIPHRVTDGYGLTPAAVAEISLAGAKLLITIDCGTNDHEEIEMAKTMGIDVIVLDHHETPSRESAAVALINPKADPGYAFKGICSAGIAFKLAWALSKGIGASPALAGKFRKFLLDAMGYVALGTVADVSPLVGENRVFVAFGLKALVGCESPGLRALAAKLGLDERVDTFDIGFKIAPRLNALGRLGTARNTVELLTTGDPARIAEIMDLMESSNRSRKQIEDAIFQQAVQQVSEAGLPDVLVVADEKWHVGVVGIVASRLVEKYARPAFVLAIDGDVAKGSGRSVDGFKLHEAIEASRDLVVSGGGHAKAAGVGLKRERLDDFRARVNEYAAKVMAAGLPEPTLRLDEEVNLQDVTRGLVKELQRLEPHGEANPAPRLAASHLRVAGEPRLMGKTNAHLSFHVSQETGPALRAVAFGKADWYDALVRARSLSLAFRPVINEWRGNETVELHVDDARFS